MPANALPRPVLTSFIDAQGHRVTASVAYSGLAVVHTATPDEGITGGHPALTREMCRELGEALIRHAESAP